MRCELLVERETRCRRAKSARINGLREAVYTVRPGALSTALAGRVAEAAVNSSSAVGGSLFGRCSGVRVSGPRRFRSVGLAAAATPCGAANLRRARTELEPRPSRGRPGRPGRPARLRRRGGDRDLCRNAGRPSAGVAGPPGRPAHQLRAGSGPRTGGATGGRRHGDRRIVGRTSGLPCCGVPALGLDVGSGFPCRLCRSAGVVGVDADPAQTTPATGVSACRRHTFCPPLSDTSQLSLRGGHIGSPLTQGRV
jgi:hypothetical protein